MSKTIVEVLEQMAEPNTLDNYRWRALATILRQLCVHDCIPLNRNVEVLGKEREPQREDE